MENRAEKTDPDTIDPQEIREAIGRTLWMSAYADEVERASEEEERGASQACAGPGQDWDEVTPETPAKALKAGVDLAFSIARLNCPASNPGEHTDETLKRLCAEWQDAGGGSTQRYSAEDRFGHCLAMQALGHGVGCSDDVRYDAGYESPEFPFYCEAYVTDWRNPASFAFSMRVE